MISRCPLGMSPYDILTFVLGHLAIQRPGGGILVSLVIEDLHTCIECVENTYLYTSISIYVYLYLYIYISISISICIRYCISYRYILSISIYYLFVYILLISIYYLFIRLYILLFLSPSPAVRDRDHPPLFDRMTNEISFK